ncbi:MAG TPA: hypothetical protein VGB45_16395 [Abditibacterium sp.]
MKIFQEPFVGEHELHIEGEAVPAKIDGWRVFFRCQRWPQDILGYAPETEYDLVAKGFWSHSWEWQECERVISLSELLSLEQEEWFLSLSDCQTICLHYRRNRDERFSATSCDLKSVLTFPRMERWTFPTKEFHLQLQAALSDSESALTPAIAYLRLSVVEQQWAQVEFERGTRGELEHIAKAILQVHPDAFRKTGVRYVWFKFSATEPVQLEFSHDMVDLKEWNQCLNHYICARRISMPFWSSKAESKDFCLSIRLPVQSPSHHEYLEATLFLRKWAKDKMDPATVQKLFSAP